MDDTTRAGAQTRALLRQRIRAVRKLPRTTTEDCYLTTIILDGGGLSRVGLPADTELVALIGGAKPEAGALAIVERPDREQWAICFAYEVEGGVRGDWPECEGRVWHGAKIIGKVIAVVATEAREVESDADEWPEYIAA